MEKNEKIQNMNRFKMKRFFYIKLICCKIESNMVKFK